MAGETQFTIGAPAHCSDGSGGEVTRIVIDPATRTITHLVIEPKHHRGPGRLVSLDLVDTADGEIRLDCTLAELGGLDPAEEVHNAEGMPSGGLGPRGLDTPPGLPHLVKRTVEDAVPRGEVELHPDECVHAVDGEIGHVHGFIVDSSDHRVTHVLLKEGHLWGRKEVAIPVGAVKSVEYGIVLNITKKQVEELPPLSH